MVGPAALKLVQIGKAFCVNHKGLRHESSSEKLVMRAPSWEPTREMTVGNHLTMVRMPAFDYSSARKEFNEGKPVFVGLPKIRLRKGFFARKGSFIDGRLASTIPELDTAELHILI